VIISTFARHTCRHSYVRGDRSYASVGSLLELLSWSFGASRFVKCNLSTAPDPVSRRSVLSVYTRRRYDDNSRRKAASMMIGSVIKVEIIPLAGGSGMRLLGIRQVVGSVRIRWASFEDSSVSRRARMTDDDDGRQKQPGWWRRRRLDRLPHEFVSSR